MCLPRQTHHESTPIMIYMLLGLEKKILVSGKKKFEKWPGHPGVLFFYSGSRGGENHVISPKVLTQSLWNFPTL